MRIHRLRAQDVNGYYHIDVTFLPDLTFLVGLNGSGKTTALRLLMGLLTPSIYELVRLEFSVAEVEIYEGTKPVTIRATKGAGELTLSVSGHKEKLSLNAVTLQFLTDSRQREDISIPPARLQLEANEVYQRIREIPTPMYLGLGRRIYREDDFETVNTNKYTFNLRDLGRISHRNFDDYVYYPTDVADEGIDEVSRLIWDTMNDIRVGQETLDNTLRQKLLSRALEFRVSQFDNFNFSSQDLARMRDNRTDFEWAATVLGLPTEQVLASFDIFINKMTGIFARISQIRETFSNKSSDNTTQGFDQQLESVMEWITNKAQIDQISENIELFKSFATERDALREPVKRLLHILNKFFEQTDKIIEIGEDNRIRVRLPNGQTTHLGSLASGERQLCVMLNHLTLNKKLAGSGVFIVDEPELSLHVSWQEMFADSVIEANKDVQLIFATHSPAIILDKVQNCRFVSGNVNA